MTVSVFDLFKIGIGPSSSHTVGPMRAAFQFASSLAADGLLDQVGGIRAELFGSLGATGHGHGSVPAVVLGLSGEQPETVDPAAAGPAVAAVRDSGMLRLLGRQPIRFSVDDDVILHRRKRLEFHSNAMRFAALDQAGAELSARTYYSVGGGFVLGEDEVEAGLLRIWAVMQECVANGCAAGGVLPGGLKVRRRARALQQILEQTGDTADPLYAMEWVTLYALAVNEENAAGGRVVTAPTNGKRLDLRRRGGLPGRGRVRLLDGRGWPGRGDGRDA